MHSQSLHEIVAEKWFNHHVLKASISYYLFGAFYFMEEIMNDKPPFEYKNKIEWCPEIEGFVTYVLRLENGHLYKGFTSNFRQRMLNHFNGMGCQTTKKSSPIYVYHYEVFTTKAEAIARERYFKTIGGGELKNLANPNTIKP